MITSLQVRRIFGVITIFFCLTSLVSGYFYFFFRNIAINEQKDAASQLHVEVLHLTAKDGVPQKALLYVNPTTYILSDHAAPLIICCHGMSDNYFAFNDLYFSLTKRGYAVIAPEFRGHGSNPSPLTFGVKEPSDIIEWLDYAEVQLEFINITRSGIYGFSMGGYYATMAYILESKGEQRLKTLIAVSSPVNITRELSKVTNQPQLLGNIPVFQDINQKNAITYINQTFPRNILIIHGDMDNTVSIENSYDFLAAANPNNDRSDFSFYIYPNYGHTGTGFNKTTYKIAISWFEQYVSNKTVNQSEIYIYPSPISQYNGMILYYWLAGLVISLICLIGSSVYVMNPALFKIHEKVNFKEKINSEKQDDPVIASIEGIKTRIFEYSNKSKFIFFGIYSCSVIFGGLINFLFNPIFYMKFGIISLSILFAYLICTIYTIKNDSFEKVKDILSTGTNLKITRIFLVIIGVGFLTFLLIVSSPREIDVTLGPGARFTYLIPILVIIILGILEGPILFVRSFFLPRLSQNFKERIIETIVVGLLLTFSMIIAFVWFKSAVVFGILFFPMIVQATFWLGIGLMFIVHIFEKIHQSIHPMLFFIASIIAIGIGSSQLYLIF